MSGQFSGQIMALKFALGHNSRASLEDPPEEYRMFSRMVTVLRNCKLTHALTVNPDICKEMIREFWTNANSFKATSVVPERITSRIQNTDILITEEVIREVLQIRDSHVSPMNVPNNLILEVLERMDYQQGNSKFPPAYKKLFPPFWKLLFHTFAICLSGRKGGSGDFSAATSGAVVSLAMDWDYNFSRYIFLEMKSNLTGKKSLFSMYPRLIQQILDVKYTMLRKSNNLFDIKILNASTFSGMMRSGAVFKEFEELEMIGIFDPAAEENLPVEDIDVAADEEMGIEHISIDSERTASVHLDEEIVDEVNQEVIVEERAITQEEIDEALDDVFGPDPLSHLSQISQMERRETIYADLQEIVRSPPQSVPVTSTVPVVQNPPRVEEEPVEAVQVSRKRQRLSVSVSDISSISTPVVTIPQPTAFENIADPAAHPKGKAVIIDMVDVVDITPNFENIQVGGMSGTAEAPPPPQDPNLEGTIHLVQMMEEQNRQDAATQAAHVGLGDDLDFDFDGALDFEDLPKMSKDQFFARVLEKWDEKIDALEKENQRNDKRILDLKSGLRQMNAELQGIETFLLERFPDLFPFGPQNPPGPPPLGPPGPPPSGPSDPQDPPHSPAPLDPSAPQDL